MSGILSVVGTPIGNLDDLSPRAAHAIAQANLIACEDTRVAAKLRSRAPTDAKMIAYHARNEHGRIPELVRAVASGARVVLTTDAGMPGVSDPGQRLVAACIAAGLHVEVIPGPSAVLTALVASGLPTARFVFEGFLPRTRTARRRRLEALAVEPRTIVLFESPHRIVDSLDDMAVAFGALRRAVLARELTKMHEEVLRATVAELAQAVRERPPRGEITLVVEGAEVVVEDVDDEDLVIAVSERVATGTPKKQAIADVAAQRDVSKKRVYQAVLDAEAEREEDEV